MNRTNTHLPPPPPANGAARPHPQQAQQPAKTFSVVGGRIDCPQRVLMHGAGGIGKSTLASLTPSPVFFDIEGSTRDMDVPRIEGLESFADVRAALQSNVVDGYQTIILDSATKAQELAIRHTLETVKHEKGRTCSNIEDYGFGKGYQHVYDTFLLLLSDLDRQITQGRNVIIVAHSCIETVPNPMGDDFIRYEPHLQSPRSGKSDIRNRLVQWSDHVLFVGYDVISKDGKGMGGGTRTIYTSELPSHIAKSRRVSVAQPFTSPEDGSIWTSILGGNCNE